MLLTRTALSALRRLQKGEPAFRTPIPRGQGVIGLRIAANRREALEDLTRLRYVAKTPKGPVITATGLAALNRLDKYFNERAKLQRLGRPTRPSVAAETAFGMDASGMASRLGIEQAQVYARDHWAATPLKFD